jgi:PKD repeat protein
MKKLYLLCLLLSAGFAARTQDHALFTAVAQGLSVNFQNTSTVNDTSIKRAFWTFGDGSPVAVTAARGGIVHTYSQPGTYIACLRIFRMAANLQDTLTMTGMNCGTVVITATPPPDSCRAEFSVQQSGNAAPFVLALSGQSWHNNNKPVVSACWNYGDGTTSCSHAAPGLPASLVATHTYPSNGTYSICLTLTYEGGCSRSFCRTVVLPATGIPHPDSCGTTISSALVNPVNPMRLGFISNPVHNNLRLPWRTCFNFGDGRDTCITYPNGYSMIGAVHTYSNPGTYNVCVTVDFEGGCQTTRCSTIIVHAPPQPPADTCHADLNIAAVSNAPLGRVFTAVPWHNNQKRVIKVCWLFGNGRDTCISYPAGYTGDYSIHYTYTGYGNYTVCAVIYYEGGCQSTRCHSFQLQPAPPPPIGGNCTVHLGISAFNNPPLLRLIRASPDTGRRPVNVCWNWGDNSAGTCVQQPNPATAASLTAGHTYAAPGTYLVCVRMEYDGGCIAQKCEYVQVHGSANCSVAFSDTALTADLYRFEAAAQVDPGDSILSYRWIFGDGTAALGRVLQHHFASGGNYQVCVVTNTRNGCEARQCRLVTVNAPGIVLLSIHPNPVGTLLNANFHALAPGAATIRIVNALGLVVRTETRSCFPGMNFWTFNVAQLPTGYYTMIVQAPNQYAAQAFFKQ